MFFYFLFTSLKRFQISKKLFKIYTRNLIFQKFIIIYYQLKNFTDVAYEIFRYREYLANNYQILLFRNSFAFYSRMRIASPINIFSSALSKTVSKILWPITRTYSVTIIHFAIIRVFRLVSRSRKRVCVSKYRKLIITTTLHRITFFVDTDAIIIE